MPLVTAPAFPELYETDVLPLVVYGSPLTEVFKLKIGDDKEKEERAKETWKNLISFIGNSKSLSGVSVNIEEKTFLGVIGWESQQVCDFRIREGIN